MKFRTKSSGTKTINLAGGKAYAESPKLELVSLLLTSFVSDKFYEKATDQLDRLALLVHRIPDKLFAAKAGIYARTKFGMRSITHALISEVAHWAKGCEWLKRAVDKIVYRPDDALEIMSYYQGKYGPKLSHGLEKGLALSVKKFDAYQLAKYRGTRSNVKMVDLFNMVHPRPDNEEQATVYRKLMRGELKSTDTWETKLTQAGQEAAAIEDESERAEKLQKSKAESWKELLISKKLGYFALLRNLRNILEQAPEAAEEACAQLVNEKAIKKSLVLPFRFNTAAAELAAVKGSRQMMEAVNDALEISLSNVPKFSGRTLVALDESGSMQGRPVEIGSLFAAVLYKTNNADLLTFSDSARFRNMNSRDSALSLAQNLQRDFSGGGTSFNSIFKKLDEKYDRIFILSDMQGWMGDDDDFGFMEGGSPDKTFAAYKKRTGADPFVYSIDLNGYGTLQFPERNVFAVAGFSEKIFDLIKYLETDRDALVAEIDKIEI